MVEATKCEGNRTKKYTFTYDANGNLTHECFRNKAEVTYQYDTENRLVAVYDQQKLLVASTYDGDGNRAFQLNYNSEATCGYGMNVSGEIFMPEHSQNEDESLTAEGQLFSYICSKTGRAYDLTEYVNDTNRQYVETLTAYTINSGATESYSYAGNQRLSRNNIWDEAQGVRCNQTSYYLYDGRGSVTANIWYNGMVTDVYQYDPYGQVELGSTKHTDFYGYNAESYNPNSGLEFLRARYYNANQGRFFQEDTYLGDIIDPLTLNRYAYVKNSPMNYVDPSGHKNEVSIANPSNADPIDTIQLPKQNGIISLEELKELLQASVNALQECMNVVNDVTGYLAKLCFEMLETSRMDMIKNIIAQNPGDYGKAKIKEQLIYTNQAGTFGPLGNISANGCGSIALHNVLDLMGYRNSYGDMLLQMNQDWMELTILGGKLGSNPLYILEYLERYKHLVLTPYVYSDAVAAGKIDEHKAYLNLYFYKVGAYYTAAKVTNNGLKIYNDTSATDYEQYFNISGAKFMIVLGIDNI